MTGAGAASSGRAGRFRRRKRAERRRGRARRSPDAASPPADREERRGSREQGGRCVGPTKPGGEGRRLRGAELRRLENACRNGGVENRPRRRDAEDHPDAARGAEEARHDAEVLAWRGAHHRAVVRRLEGPRPEAEDDEAEDHGANTVAFGPRGEQKARQRADRAAARRERHRTDPVRQRSREGSHGEDGKREGRQDEADARRPLVKDAREKERRHEDDDVLGHEVQDGGEAPEAERGAPEEPKVEERLRRPALDRDERGAEEDGGGEKRGGDGVDAALLNAVHREQKRRERAEDRERARHVDPSRPAPEVRQNAPREREGGEPDRQIHEKNGAPAERRREKAPEARPHREADGDAAGEEADDPSPVGGRERPGQDGERNRRHHSGCEALQGPEPDERVHGRGRRAENRRRHETEEAGEEDAPVAPEVSQPPEEEDEASRRHEVEHRHPLRRREARLERPRDRRKDDVDNARVDRTEDRAEHDGGEDRAPSGRANGCLGGLGMTPEETPSHSIVPGGFDVTSDTTRFTPRTSP